MESTEKRTRNALSVGDRKLICQLKLSNPEWNNPKIAEEAGKQLNRVVVRNTVCRILAKSEKWLSAPEWEDGRKKERKPKWAELESVLVAYCHQEIAKNRHVTGMELAEKAKEVAQALQLEDFTCSSGWVDNFKRRNHLKRSRKSSDPQGSDKPSAGSVGTQSKRRKISGAAKTATSEQDSKQSNPGQQLSDALEQNAAQDDSALLPPMDLAAIQHKQPAQGEAAKTQEHGVPLTDSRERQAPAQDKDGRPDAAFLVSQHEAIASAKLLIVYLSERPSLEPEVLFAMQKVAGAITRQT